MAAPDFLTVARSRGWTLDTPTTTPSSSPPLPIHDEPLWLPLVTVPSSTHFRALVELGDRDSPETWAKRFSVPFRHPLNESLAAGNLRAVRWLVRRAHAAGCPSTWFEDALGMALRARQQEASDGVVRSPDEQRQFALCVRAVWPSMGCSLSSLRRTRATSRIWPGFAHLLFHEPHGFRRLLHRVLPMDARLGRIGWAAFTLSNPSDMSWTVPFIHGGDAVRVLVGELQQHGRMDGWKKAYRGWTAAIETAGGARLPGLVQAREAARVGQDRWEAHEVASRLDGVLPVVSSSPRRRRM